MATVDTPRGTEGAELRVGLRTRTFGDERLGFCRQIGARDVFVDHRQPRGDVFTDEGSADEHTLTIDEGTVPPVTELVDARRRIENAGLGFAGIQSLSYNVYGKIMRGSAGREEQLETITTLIRRLGAAEIPILGYQWNPRGLVPMRTAPNRVRGGAEANAFDIADIDDPYERVPDLDREYSEEELWSNYEWFLERVLPVAEDAGVTLALHPADPPTVEQLGGMPRLFRTPEAFERALATVPSERHGLKLCLGCFSEMPDTDVPAIIRQFGDDIVFVHFRNVRGTWPSFSETFVDDADANFDAVAAMRALRDVGFAGVVVPDHVPGVIGDTDWGHRGRAHAVGYLNGLVDATRSP